MAVYFIRAGEDGPVKIGVAADPHARLSDLQTAHHATLHLIRIIDIGTSFDERELHGKFAPHHIRGEWFHFVPEMLTIELDYPKHPGSATTRLREWLQDNGLSEAEFAQRVGVDQKAINNYCRGLRTPRPRIVRLIEAATSGEVRWSDFDPALHRRLAASA